MILEKTSRLFVIIITIITMVLSKITVSCSDGRYNRANLSN